MASGSYMMDYNSGANKIVSVLALTLGISVIIGVFIIILFSKHIALPIKKIANHVKEVADGNLVLDELKVKNKDEVGELANGFEQMIVQLKALLHEVSDSAEQVAGSSQELSASSEHNARATEEINGSIQEVATGVEVQSTKMKQMIEQTINISNSTDQIHLNTKSMHHSAEKTNEIAKKGKDYAQTGIQQMIEAANHVETMEKTALKLNEKSVEIESMLSQISAVADQTNLLALNAAIEAARAGEHGRGFAIVAEEVRKLAEQSGKVASGIGVLMNDIRQETEDAVMTMKTGKQSVLKCQETVDQTGQAFHDIYQSSNGVYNKTLEVSKSIEEVHHIIELLVANSKEISNIIEEEIRFTNQVAAATEEQTASMEQITASAISLAKLSEHLQIHVQKFKL
ncbi:methyl-accepting chemotaxis protein [Bacillus sp. 31A1R]|uniref:Methyl-accepting chemotaxis protein n=1 Tax=Robertmurraya mangrovi TaxID=3098077 RepID=A0ABU5ITV6_9BACI|nr:methyl-accepting chemotaxis protein [Bacillus sp. 31A1R]MDZ5470563.1 methyl-accepting chemotaxis protein [Bacillus sp. 31A1R]